MDSPYASHLHTNYTPTDAEILHIKELLTDPLARLSDQDAEIARLQSILDALHRECRVLNEEIEAHRALISPIRQLSHDVIGEIFVHCLPENRNAVMSAQEAPILLGRICSAWRSIALSSPRLWASLHIPTPIPVTSSQESSPQPDPVFVGKMERRREVAREWIVRSGECPLSISINTPKHIYYSGTQYLKMGTFDMAIVQILSSSCRWKHVDFRAEQESFTHLQELVEGDVPMLESLVIVSRAMTSAWDLSDLVPGGRRWTASSGLLSAPKLRKLSLSYLKEDLLSLPVCWLQLTHLNLDVDGYTPFGGVSSGLTYSRVIKVMKQCPLLVSCGICLGSTRFDLVLQPDSEMSPSETLTLPLLKNFFINLSGRSDEDNLKYLHLPVLHHLEIRYQESILAGVESRPSVVIDFLSRNGATVKQLFIDIPFVARDELVHFLNSMPSLTHLHVTKNSDSCSIIDDEVVDRLTPSGDNPDCLCPMLEEFECKGSSCADFSEKRLISFIKRRSESEKGGVLKRVNVTLDRRRPKNLKDFFVSLVTEAGMKTVPNLVDKDPWADGHICVESHGLPTIVDVKYEQWSLTTDCFSPWDGLDLADTYQPSSRLLISGRHFVG